MKTLIIIVAILAFPISAMCAGPYLTSDCTPAVDKVTGFNLQFGTQAWITIPAMTTCVSETACTGDSRRICYDLGTMPNGFFTVKARAANLWGQSNDSDPLSDTKSLPGSPLLLKITK